MPKNKKGGKSHKKSKNNREDTRRQLEFKEHGQEYATVTKMLGNGRVTATCFDGKERLCIIRGKMRKRVWINVGDIILIGLRDFQDNKADVIDKYTIQEARQLKALGEIPSNANIGGSATVFEDDEDNDCAFDFDAI
jgi:translation initiation factor 1A